MKNIIRPTAYILSIWLSIFWTALYAQDGGSLFGGIADDKVAPTEVKEEKGNGVLEGIQFSSEALASNPEDSLITCYFIFQKKPSNYFYDANPKKGTIWFEFNDAVKSEAPIPTVSHFPIKGFRLEAIRVDANKEVVGLNPEWHDVLRVNFFADIVPIFDIKDEYSIISFSFKWSSDPKRQKMYTMKSGNKPLALGLSVGGTLLGLGGLGLGLFFGNKKSPNGDDNSVLSADDLPVHPSK